MVQSTPRNEAKRSLEVDDAAAAGVWRCVRSRWGTCSRVVKAGEVARRDANSSYRENRSKMNLACLWCGVLLGRRVLRESGTAARAFLGGVGDGGGQESEGWWLWRGCAERVGGGLANNNTETNKHTQQQQVCVAGHRRRGGKAVRRYTQIGSSNRRHHSGHTWG